MANDPATEGLDLAELSDRADVSPRTVRYYIQQGLLPSPESRGPGARYGAEHLDRLRLIRRLQREHLPLAEIRRRIHSLDPAEIRRLVEGAPERERSSALDYIRGALSEPAAMLSSLSMPSSLPPLSSLMHHAELLDDAASPGAGQLPKQRAPRSPTRSQWDRIALAPDVELHVRRPLSREQNRQVERLMEAARDIFEEDAS